MKKLYVDFDGVLINTPKYIREEIVKYGNRKKTFKNIKWNELLLKSDEICNNIEWIKQEFNNDKNFDISIITHFYSKQEMKNKTKFIRNNIGDINILFVPYYINKCDFVDARGELIIDDYKKTINLWKTKGGIGILYKEGMKLEDLLQSYMKENYYGE